MSVENVHVGTTHNVSTQTAATTVSARTGSQIFMGVRTLQWQKASAKVRISSSYIQQVGHVDPIALTTAFTVFCQIPMNVMKIRTSAVRGLLVKTWLGVTSAPASPGMSTSIMSPVLCSAKVSGGECGLHIFFGNYVWPLIKECIQEMETKFYQIIFIDYCIYHLIWSDLLAHAACTPFPSFLDITSYTLFKVHQDLYYICAITEDNKVFLIYLFFDSLTTHCNLTQTAELPASC